MFKTMQDTAAVLSRQCRTLQLLDSIVFTMGDTETSEQVGRRTTATEDNLGGVPVPN